MVKKQAMGIVVGFHELAASYIATEREGVPERVGPTGGSAGFRT